MIVSKDLLHKIQGARTPFYLYDQTLLDQTLHEIKSLTEIYPQTRMHYAVKANSNTAVLSRIAQYGFGADCVSGGEIKRCIEAGFDANHIVYAGVGKSDEEIIYALRQNIECFNVESEAELDVIQSLAEKENKTARIALRLNPNVDAHTHANITTGKEENKFGIPLQEAKRIILKIGTMSHVVYHGLHFHIGSQILDLSPFCALCDVINHLQEELSADGIRTGSINVGGGLGVDYEHPELHPVPEFRQYFKTFCEHLELQPGQTLHFELGRSIVAQCGSLITKVLYLKPTKSKQFLIVDAGFTDLIRPALYDAHHKIEKLSSAIENSNTNIYDVVGPICESSDVFACDYPLPPCQRGDLLSIRSAGAYGEVMASTYNCRELIQGYLDSEL